MKDDEKDKVKLEDKVKELVNEFGAGTDPQHLRLAMLAKQAQDSHCLLYTSPSPRDQRGSRMPSSA